ncbi:hypothetical protein [Amycolatopsis sp. NPDC051102]|uniref:hypothetical protein n=1 Tax=Amycolatopsis sp. NPDC051102 TaxID=3155163 RepID=UPI00342E0645
MPGACDNGNNPSLDGHAALAYDALALFAHAMQELKPVPVSSGAVWHAISNMRGDNLFSGETGAIDFSGGRTPLNKFAAVLRVEQGRAPKPVGTCGVAHHPTQDEPWCPR